MRIRVPKLRHRLHSIRARTALLFDLAVASSVALAAAIAPSPSVAVLRWAPKRSSLRRSKARSSLHRWTLPRQFAIRSQLTLHDATAAVRPFVTVAHSCAFAAPARFARASLQKTGAMSSPKPQKTQRMLPPQGQSAEGLLELMAGYKEQDEARWKDGQLSGAVYHGDEDHLDLLNEAAGMFSVSNPLHSSTWPSVNKFEAEVIAMTASLLNGGDDGVCGCMTSGGTESILMAAKTHRQWGEVEKGITEPEVICAGSAHAAIYKAADILRLKIVEVPIDEVTMEMDIGATKAAVTPNTVLIYASAPNYPHGVIDPIGALSEIALEHNVGLHVDCCLGGFVLPFARTLRGNIPDFDFTLPGVTSISADTHKYGYATKGTSVVLYRSKDLRKHQFFTFPKWQGGNYGTPSTAGSRPGTLSAAAWASMMRLGEEGYLEATERLLSTTEALTAAIQRIPGIHVMGGKRTCHCFPALSPCKRNERTEDTKAMRVVGCICPGRVASFAAHPIALMCRSHVRPLQIRRRWSPLSGRTRTQTLMSTRLPVG
jgi:glutamate/tyrosine decarboxylase-like PLP-dependent enzyme